MNQSFNKDAGWMVACIRIVLVSSTSVRYGYLMNRASVVISAGGRLERSSRV